jgi:hypothetical protein
MAVALGCEERPDEPAMVDAVDEVPIQDLIVFREASADTRTS